jgi:hypothetical protein
MAATLTVRVNTGTSAGTQSDAVTGIDFISADNATNSLVNRQAYPIAAGGAPSYEKWLTLRVDVAPDNGVTNFEVWGDGAVDANTTLYAGVTGTAATPVNTTSSVATADFTDYTTGSRLTWDAASLTTVGDVTDFLVLQLVASASAEPGNWTQETIYYSYTET